MNKKADPAPLLSVSALILIFIVILIFYHFGILSKLPEKPDELTFLLTVPRAPV